MLIRALLILSVFGLSACETVKGVGRDITNAGEAVSDAL
ncbi:entericidin A/B family lipoprotein [Yoonia maritima]